MFVILPPILASTHTITIVTTCIHKIVDHLLKDEIYLSVMNIPEEDNTDIISAIYNLIVYQKNDKDEGPERSHPLNYHIPSLGKQYQPFHNLLATY